jgi:GNAT superfamily N-acetyltransferase
MSDDALVMMAVDPRSPEAIQLVRALSRELAQRYEFTDDGSGDFKPEDVLGPRSAFLLGRVDGRPVACGAFRPLEGDVCEIKRMFVAPDCRGRKYAKVVLAELERLAASLGYAIARLETANRQPEAIGLYERAGYRRIPNFGIYAGSERSVCFEKWLGTPGGRAEPGAAAGRHATDDNRLPECE